MSALGAEPSGSSDPLRTKVQRWLGEVLLRDWGLKAIALVVAAFLFVFTRDEVTRVFTVPLKVVEDPERVLMTDLPQTVQVQARGPWTRINRLQDYDFGVATLDLHAAKPGPLEVDRAAIVMPSGVVLAGIQYDHVDLRFDPVVEREVEVQPQLEGTPAPDYELGAVEAVPPRVRVRGGESVVRRVQGVATLALDVQGADHDVEGRVALVDPPDGVAWVGVAEDAAVTVRAAVAARQELRTVTVAVAVDEGLDPTGAVPRRYEVTLRGPMPDFRVLDGLGVEPPVVARATQGDGEGLGGGVAEVRFGWAEGVPQHLRDRIELGRAVVRVDLPVPPPPPAPDVPAPQ